MFEKVVLNSKKANCPLCKRSFRQKDTEISPGKICCFSGVSVQKKRAAIYYSCPLSFYQEIIVILFSVPFLYAAACIAVPKR